MKTAWIFPGGSARTVYTAGVMYGLSQLGIPKPDILIAASGSAPTSVCYVTGQNEIIRTVWLECLSTWRFRSYFRFWKILNIDYLIDDVLRKRYPLDMQKLRESHIRVYFPLTNAQTGELQYVSNRDDLDFWQVLRASITVPIFTSLFSQKGSPVADGYFCDSTPASRFQLHIKRAIAEGADTIIVFDNWHPGDNPTRYFFSTVYAYMRNARFRHQQMAYLREMDAFVPPRNVKYLHLVPLQRLGMSRFDIDNENAREVFMRGVSDIHSAADQITGFMLTHT